MPNLPQRYAHSMQKGAEPPASVGVSADQPYHECAGGCGEMVRAFRCSPCAERVTQEWMLTRKMRRG